MRGKIVRIKGLQEFKDRHGKLRRYHRKSKTPIDPNLSGEDLYDEVRRLDEKFAEVKPIAGTLGALIDNYQKTSNHWHTLSERTQKDYRRVFKYIEKIEAREEPVMDITTPDIAYTRDAAADAHEVKFANQLVITLKMVFKFGIEYGYATTNPAIGVTKLRGGNKRPNRPYTAKELVAILDNAPAQLLGPIYAAAIYGLREGDIVKLSKTAIRDEWIVPTTSKRKKPVWLPITPTMQKLMDTQLNDNCTTVFANSRGTPWTEDGLKSTWGKYKQKLEDEGLIEPAGTFHGFRNTVTTLLEENGFDDSDIKFLVTHAPKNMTEFYSINAQRKKLLIDMVDCLENLIEKARGNVVNFKNRM